ncbi:MAG: GNAT family N-acetyltransferase [Deltaproteobacteria bacterium]|nr:GNAT family N-acetyltransferase [Deltaproteobacteria bacterium]
MAVESEARHLDPAITVPSVEAVIEDYNKGFYLVAEAGGEVIGQLMVTWEWSDWRGGVMWWVQSVYVREDFRRKGIYRKLYTHLRDMAQGDEQCRGIRLYVETENVRAQKTYASLGMKKASYFVFEEDFVFTPITGE